MRARLSLIPGLLLLILLPSLFAGAAGAETVLAERRAAARYEIPHLWLRDAELPPEERLLTVRVSAVQVFVDSIEDETNYLPLAKAAIAKPYWPDVLREEFLAALDWAEALTIGDPDEIDRVAREVFEPGADSLPPARPISWRLAEALWALGKARGHLPSEYAYVRYQLWYVKVRDYVVQPYMLEMLWTLAGEKDYPPAQLDLAERYETGRGVTQDLAKAYFWYGQAYVNRAVSGLFLKQFLERLTDQEFVRQSEYSYAHSFKDQYPPL